MKYHMRIEDTESKKTILRTKEGLKNCNTIELNIGEIYEIYIANPNNKKQRANNGRRVELLGFNDTFNGSPIVKYLDTGRRGTAGINELKPIKEVGTDE